MYRLHTHCRACGFAMDRNAPGTKTQPVSDGLIKVFVLGLQPPPNDFRRDDEERAGFAPLEVLFCPRCTLAQLSVVVHPSILYSNYPYVTSKSDTMKAHFSELWAVIRSKSGAANVLEFGSNDGDFLKFCLSNGAERVIGIDPAENLVSAARMQGVQSLCAPFDKDSAHIAGMEMPRVDVIVARHVFCHINDWLGTMKAIDSLSNPDTLVVIEVPYVLDLLGNNEFDTIYFEHLSYMSLKAMNALLRGGPFQIHDVASFDVHGGSIAIILSRKDGCREPKPVVEEMLNAECITAQDWLDFAQRASGLLGEFRALVDGAAEKGKTVVGYGASAKSSVWLNACGFKKDKIKFVCDNTPSKTFRKIPGTDIPVVGEHQLVADMPDYAICFAWNFKDEICRKNAYYLNHGGHFVFPVPKLEIVGT